MVIINTTIIQGSKDVKVVTTIVLCRCPVGAMNMPCPMVSEYMQVLRTLPNPTYGKRC
jgi:hypothetical protein